MEIRKSLRYCVIAAFALGFTAVANTALAQGAVITGKVTTDQGREIQGANVIIPELNISVGTNAAGNYSITIPTARLNGSSTVLRVRAIGYVPKSSTVTLTAGDQTTNFSLAQDINRLEAVVTTGVTGATVATKLPFAVSHVDASDLKVPGGDPLSQLAGKVPGASIVSVSGRPGASPAVLLRGPTAITGAGRGQSPLYIIDGVILTDQGSSTGGGGLPDINPQDIESYEVVKGAAASSLYGARAGNGVISIKTKSGLNSADGVKFNVRTEYGKSDIENHLAIAQGHALELDESGTRFCITVSGAGRFQCARSIDYAAEAFRINDQGTDFALAPIGTFPVDPGSSLAKPDPALTSSFLNHIWPGNNYDAVAQFVNPRPLINNVVDMRGHYGNTAFFASASSLDQGGAIDFLNGFQRKSGRINLDQQIGSRWSASLTSYFARGQKDGFYTEDNGNGAFFRLTRTPPIVNLEQLDSKGRLFIRPNLQGAGSQNNNPLYPLQNDAQFTKTNHFIGGGTLRFVPASWLNFEGNLSYDGSQNNLDNFDDKGYRTTAASAGDVSFLRKSTENLQSYNSSLNMNVLKDVLTDMHSRTSFRYLFERQDYDYRRGQAGGLSVVGVPTLDNGTISKSVTSTNTSIRSIGFFMGEDIDWKDRYIVSAIVRRDGSSLFGRANRWKTFGRGSVAWRLSQEPWWIIPALNEFKLRASVGTAGGRPGFDWQYETFNVANGVISPQILGNRFLKPESIRENEYGLEMEAFHRFAGTLNYSISNARDQILRVPSPSVTGFGFQWKNAGVLQNKTLEASINVPIINGRDLSYSTRFIYDRNRAVITHLYVPSFTFGATAQATDQIFLAKEGERYGTFYGRVFATSCSQLPSQVAAACGTPGAPFQRNSDGFIVWVGAGNTPGDGITSNLWQSRLPANSPFYAPVASGVNGLINPSVQITWGMPLIVRDSTGTATKLPLGNPLPNYRWGFSQNLSFKRFTAYALIDAAIGQHVYNQGRGWSFLDFLEGGEAQLGKSVDQAKPLGYYYRAGSPDNGSGVGGLYDLLGPNSAMTEDASYAKLRELSVGFRLGRFGSMGGDWNLNVVGRNLHTWTKYHGFDPEVGFGAVSGAGSTANGTGSAALNAIDAFTFPNLRSLTFSLQTSF
jgi:TonB-linked SusC/RagA family outer membrane protein